MFNEKELKTLKNMVTVSIDIHEDMLLEDMPFDANDIRVLASKSDERINQELHNARKELNKKIKQYVDMCVIKQKLNDA